MLVAHPRHRLDRSELDALRAARGSEVAAELRQSLWREGLQGRPLASDDVNQRVDPSHRCKRAESIPALKQADQPVELVQNELEPELARLMHDDEQELVGVLGLRAGTLKAEELVEREVGRVGDLLALTRERCRTAGLAILSLQNVETSSAATSSTRIVSVV